MTTQRINLLVPKELRDRLTAQAKAEERSLNSLVTEILTHHLVNKEEAKVLLEDVLDILTEVGNGVTEKNLITARENLFKFRNQIF